MSHAKGASTAALALGQQDPDVKLVVTEKDASKCSVNDDGAANTWSAGFKKAVPHRVTSVFLQGRTDVNYYAAGASQLAGATVKIGDTVCGTTRVPSVSGWVEVKCEDAPVEGDSVTVESAGDTGLAICGVRVVGNNCADRDDCEGALKDATEAWEKAQWEELDAQNTYELFEEEKDERTAAKEKADAVNEAQKALDDMAKE